MRGVAQNCRRIFLAIDKRETRARCNTIIPHFLALGSFVRELHASRKSRAFSPSAKSLAYQLADRGIVFEFSGISSISSAVKEVKVARRKPAGLSLTLARGNRVPACAYTHESACSTRTHPDVAANARADAAKHTRTCISNLISFPLATGILRTFARHEAVRLNSVRHCSGIVSLAGQRAEMGERDG